MKVRQASAEDLPQLVSLFEELDRMQHDWRVFTPRPGFYDEVAGRFREALRADDRVVLVAEDEGEVVGMAYAEVRIPSRFSDERALELSGVVVRAGHRGRGVGRALVAEAARFAKEQGVGWMELKSFWPNKTSMGFWSALDFTPRVVQLVAPTAEALRRAEKS
ncbi:MAG: N-acetyltransferase family protein [Actinomycetota bacterium]